MPYRLQFRGQPPYEYKARGDSALSVWQRASDSDPVKVNGPVLFVGEPENAATASPKGQTSASAVNPRLLEARDNGEIVTGLAAGSGTEPEPAGLGQVFVAAWIGDSLYLRAASDAYVAAVRSNGPDSERQDGLNRLAATSAAAGGTAQFSLTYDEGKWLLVSAATEKYATLRNGLVELNSDRAEAARWSVYVQRASLPASDGPPEIPSTAELAARVGRELSAAETVQLYQAHDRGRLNEEVLSLKRSTGRDR